MKFQEYTEKNTKGITITRENERTFYVLLSIDIHTDQKSNKSDAVTHAYKDALLSGCGAYTRQEFLDAVNMLGGEITVTVIDDVLTISIKSLDTHAEKMLKLFTTMMQSPTFLQSELNRIKISETNSLTEAKEDAVIQSLYALANALYGEKDRRYVVDEDTLIAELSKVTKKELQELHTKVLSSFWTYTLTAHTKLEQKAIKTLEKLRLQYNGAQLHKNPTYQKSITKSILLLKSIPSRQNIEINLGSPLLLNEGDDDYFAFVFGLNVLGKWGGFAGRLMSTVREKEGLTYGIYARMESTTLSNSGHWRIKTFFAPDKVIQGIQSTIHQTKLIADAGITKNEFERFKTILATSEALMQDSLLQNVHVTHALQLKGYSYKEMNVRKEKLRSVTQKQVNTALKKYLDVSKLVISTAGPVLHQEKELRKIVVL